MCMKRERGTRRRLTVRLLSRRIRFDRGLDRMESGFAVSYFNGWDGWGVSHTGWIGAWYWE